MNTQQPQQQPELPSSPAPSIRVDLVATAVNFLSDPAVAASPLSRRLAFLEKKGLSAQEIELALVRVQGRAQHGPNDAANSLPTGQPSAAAADKPFNWRGLAIGSGAAIATAVLIHQNMDVLKSLFAKVKAKLLLSSTEPASASVAPSNDLHEKVAALEAKQEQLQQSIAELSQQLDGKEGAISGRLMELAQEIRELKRGQREE